MKNIIDFSHELLLKNLKNTSTIIDYTCGNGNDTLFLAKNFKKVFAFDIQKQAIINTKSILDKNNINNVELIFDDHKNINQYINENIDGGIFNLGYLPKSDKSIITKKDTTIIAIEKSLSILNKNGLIIIVCYIGHKGGLDEAICIKNYCKNLNNKNFTVLNYEFINKEKCPFILAIKKLI